MDIAIIGLPLSGKTTTFNALTSGHGTATGGGGAGPLHVGVVKVIDQRLPVLEQMYHPRKIVYAEIRFWDLPPADRANRNQGLAGRHRNILQGAGALLLVVKAFDDDLQGVADPGRDLQAMLNELAIADLGDPGASGGQAGGLTQEGQASGTSGPRAPGGRGQQMP